MTAYGAGPIKRNRRSMSEVRQLERQILDVLREDHPQSIRHVFYRLTDPRLPQPIPKTDQGYKVVQRRLVDMRREGKVPYSWISDTSRSGYHTPTYANGGDFLRAHINAYRGDLWADADAYVEVWCESRSIAGVIQPLCEEMAVSLYPCGGFSSVTFAYEAAQYIKEEIEGGKEAHVIYIGDYDPAGVLIDRSLETELKRHLNGEEEDGLGGIMVDLLNDMVPGAGSLFDDSGLTFHRLAITEAQIAQYDLPTKPRKDTDKRVLHLKETVEAEAMPAKILRAMLRDAIEQYLPQDALKIAKIAEQEERAGLKKWADLMSKAT